jgi:hypothetical protein
MGVKLTKRKGFNFFRSYYDVYNELSDKDKLAFMEALLDRQFLGVKPDNLKGLAKFAYISQTNSIDSQVKGYETKTNTVLYDSSKSEGATLGATHGATHGATLQVEGKEKEKEKGKGEYRAFAHLTLSLKDADKLIALYGKVKLDDILDSIENYKQNKNYNSLYLTAGKWLKRDQAEKATQPTSHYKKFPESNQRQIATKSVSGIDLRPKK